MPPCPSCLFSVELRAHAPPPPPPSVVVAVWRAAGRSCRASARRHVAPSVFLCVSVPSRPPDALFVKEFLKENKKAGVVVSRAFAKDQWDGMTDAAKGVRGGSGALPRLVCGM
jgi:hypothetical protein